MRLEFNKPISTECLNQPAMRLYFKLKASLGLHEPKAKAVKPIKPNLRKEVRRAYYSY